MSLTAIVITNPDWFGAEQHLSDCLKTIDWCDERLIVTSRITPEFQTIAKRHQAKLELQQGTDFAAWRTHAIKAANTDWILFIDTDERVTPELKAEILTVLSSNPSHVGFALPRKNRILGRFMMHAGWYPDYVLRLIQVSAFQGYHGELHEQPVLSGTTGHLTSPLLHYKHDDIEGMLTKTITWSDTEGKLLYDSKHPPMVSYRFIRPFVTEVFTRLIKKQGVRDSTEGLIDGIYQGYSRLITYIKLWELQQRKM